MRFISLLAFIILLFSNLAYLSGLPKENLISCTLWDLFCVSYTQVPRIGILIVLHLIALNSLCT
ncbi:hypothetical protein QR685DRAFT_528972 [Neurospora intermedia]|uniref:Uncharacterized protein n=1 Tax=Neurospora intermedia TaxID=5142 RepID=A0ABR3D837_NEUIN